MAFPFPNNIEVYAAYFEPLALAYYRSGDLEKAGKTPIPASLRLTMRSSGWLG